MSNREVYDNELKESTDFAIIYSSLFSLSVSIECLQALQGILSEQGYKYAKNKAKEAEMACNTSYKQIERAMGRLGEESKKIMLDSVEVQKDIMYAFFTLDAPEQARVRGLINKIKKEQQVA